MTKSVLVFDFDGTLWGKTADAIAVMLDELDNLGIAITPGLEHDLKLQWGMHFGPLRDKHFSHVSDEDMFALFRRMDDRVRNVPYEGAAETLRLLHNRGYLLLGNTSRSRVEAMRRLSAFGMTQYITRFVSAHEIGWDRAKPSSHGLDLLLRPLEKTLGFSRTDAVLVGDAFLADRLCAKNAGIDFVVIDEEQIISRELWLEAGVRATDILCGVRELPAWLGIA